MNNGQDQGQSTFTPALNMGGLVNQVIEGLGKEDAEEMLVTLSSEGVQKALATIVSIMQQHYSNVTITDGVTPEVLNIVRYQTVGVGSTLSEMLKQGVIFAAGEHPRFKTKQN